MNDNQVEGNYFNKYQDGNFAVRFIVKNFFQALDQILDQIQYCRVYEAGCGEGYISQHVLEHGREKQRILHISASDISSQVITQASMAFPGISFKSGSIYDLQELEASYDLVIACEVLEHLTDPEAALAELFRISGRYVLISVPDEPIWRIANVLRGKYIGNLGNTPGHIQHWNSKGILRLAGKYGQITEVRKPFPWTMVLVEKQ